MRCIRLPLRRVFQNREDVMHVMHVMNLAEELLRCPNPQVQSVGLLKRHALGLLGRAPGRLCWPYG